MKSFIDLVQIEVKAGDGGDGCVSFRHEKYVPKGGPDGGNGGNGGDVFAVANSNLTTLYDFSHKHKFEAVSGEPGRGRKQFGKAGEDLTLQVPVGTVFYELKNPNTPEAQLVKILDLKEVGEKKLIAKAGKGGRGNTTYKSSTNQVPREFEQGTKGQHRQLVLELKTVADVGLIGLPNVGKSTLLACLTMAKPEIADYPFTTLSPNLGVMSYYEHKIVLADIPGLIEGAAEGKGLGDDFLRHVERTRILVHLIDPLYQDPIKAYQTIRDELRQYSNKLLEKPEIVVINKIDVTEIKTELDDYVRRFKVDLGIEVMGISAAAGVGLKELQQKIYEIYQQEKSKPSVDEDKSDHADEPVFTIQDLKHF